MSVIMVPGVRTVAAGAGCGAAAGGDTVRAGGGSGVEVTGAVWTASAGRDRGTLVAGGNALCVTAAGFACASPLNIGAGCLPDCISSTLTRIATVAIAPAATPNASHRPQPNP